MGPNTDTGHHSAGLRKWGRFGGGGNGQGLQRTGGCEIRYREEEGKQTQRVLFDSPRNLLGPNPQRALKGFMPSDEMPAPWCSWENCCSSELLAPLTPRSHWLPSSSLSYTVCLKQPSLPFLDKPSTSFRPLFTAPNAFAQVSLPPMSAQWKELHSHCSGVGFYLFIFGHAGSIES